MFDGFIFTDFFERIKKQKILIIGDVMIDTYLWGSVQRVSPEAPVPIVSNIIEENRLGGAANVALNVKSLGAIPILCSVIGGDERGKLFLELLEDQNLSDVGITVDDYRITTQKTRVISGAKHLLRVDEEIESALSNRLQSAFIDVIQNILKTGGIAAIIFQDYNKGVIAPKVIEKVTSQAKKQHIPVMVDPKFRNFSNYKNITLFKPNLKELLKGLKIEAQKTDIDILIESGQEFRKKQKQEILLLTLSEKGMLVLKEGAHYYIPAFQRDIIDVSGAGDTVIAVTAVAYAGGMNAPQLATLSNLAGGLVCEKSGVVPIERELLEKECERMTDY